MLQDPDMQSTSVPMTLDGKVVLITGGARGIGAATVRLFRQAGARVAFNYRTAKDRAEMLASECGGERLCRVFARDLDSSQAGRALVEETIAAFGRIDCLVVNHGIWPPEDAPIAMMGDEQWRRTMDVNLDSVFGLVQAAVGAMQQQTASKGEVRGHVVLVSSTAGQRG
jgi:3-oxoacyl-[acyl-carrier protein] reductase